MKIEQIAGIEKEKAHFGDDVFYALFLYSDKKHLVPDEAKIFISEKECDTMYNEILKNMLIVYEQNRFKNRQLLPLHGTDFESGYVNEDGIARLEHHIYGDKSAHTAAINLKTMEYIKE